MMYTVGKAAKAAGFGKAVTCRHSTRVELSGGRAGGVRVACVGRLHWCDRCGDGGPARDVIAV